MCRFLIKPSPVGICECAKHACRRRRDGFGNRAAVGEICECTQCSCRPRRDGFGFRLPCVRDLQVCGACLQASPRRVRKPRSGWSVKKQSLTACGGAPFTQGSRKRAFSINPCRRLTDEVYFCKRNFDYRGVCADFSLSVQTGFIKIKAEVIFSSLFLFCTKFSGSVCANEPDKEGRKIFAIK